MVFCDGIRSYLVGKIRIFVHDKIGSGGEKVDGFSGITPDEGRDIGYPGLCTTRELDVSGIGTVYSCLVGGLGCEG